MFKPDFFHKVSTEIGRKNNNGKQILPGPTN